MFSKTCEYGIKAVLFIAHKSQKDQRVGVKEIAAAIGCPEAFTGKIMQQLSKNRVVQSIKGRSGGFWINEEDRLKINLQQIVKILDGDKLYKDCVLGLAQCNDANPCPMHEHYMNIKEAITKMHVKTTIEDLSTSINSKTILR
ncbi:MAG: Rrf2 family transcriptional regulator [Saprospiraceae bacterium]|nr:Rrf2 family transcriptional regulator [Saprospiraceae bacterium]|tara:strand:+ start:4681 stop:5109 length:429 start_codon:yes stop_codon:yes gene_type:complete